MLLADYVERSNVWCSLWSDLLDSVASVNQIHGCTYGWHTGNPLDVLDVRGVYQCRYFGENLVQFRWLDVDGLTYALSVVRSLSDALWMVRRAGMLRDMC